MAMAVMLTGVESHKLRRYEDFGLITPERSEARQRLYSENDIASIKEIVDLEQEGINLKGIYAIFAMRRGERK
jgi:DNA-binding transcriptional MerR regulator